MKKYIFLLSLFLLSSISFYSCIKHDFDEPPIVVASLPFPANSTILNIKALHQPGKFVNITDDLNLHAVVIADDRTGNFYKKLVVQDSTAGIEILINSTGLYLDYPEGMKIGIKCKGMTISDYNGTVQLGYGTYLDGSNQRLSGIEASLLKTLLFKGPTGQNITPKELTIGALSKPHLSTLIKLTNVEFSRSEIGKTYADVIGGRTQNLTITDCGNQTILLRSSNFATFAGVSVPDKNGSIVGVFNVFGQDAQLFIRDTSDVRFGQAPCSAGGGSGIDKTISEIRSLFTGAASNISESFVIKGIVTSDKDGKNFNTQNLIIQDDTAGIALRFTAAHSFALGDEVQLNLNGIELSEFRGLLQLNNIATTKVSKIGSGKTVASKELTLLELNTNFEKYESQLIKLVDVSISKTAGTTYSGTSIVKQGNETIDLFTASAATFAADPLPTKSATITCIAGQFTSKQVLIRGLYDVVSSGGGGGGGGNPSDSFNISFDGLANNATLDLSGWVNQATVGTRVWLAKVFSGNVYAQATAFNDTNNEAEMWLITPKINGATPKTFSFESAKAFWVHDGLEVVISTNFDGTNIKSATWTTLPCTLAKQSDADNTFVSSGTIDLSNFTGQYHIGFVYKGNKAVNTTTYRLDNIQLKNK